MNIIKRAIGRSNRIDYAKYCEFTPSVYQKAIMDFVVESLQHLIVKATAGSGKTAILVILSQLLADFYPDRVAVFVAFNKSIATELGEKLQDVLSKTINSLFFGYYREHMGFQKARTSKYWDIVKMAIVAGGVVSPDRKERARLEKNVKKAVDIFRADLTDLDDEDEVYATAQLYSFELLPPHKWNVYKVILTYGNLIGRMGKAKEVELAIYDYPEIAPLMFTVHRKFVEKYPRFPVIDFTDQLWIPYTNGWIYPQFDDVLVDELQDLNKLQRRCLYQTMNDGGRFIGVGDPSQAIYLFGGASCSSIDDIQEELGAIDLPLSVIYRCPISHVELAKMVSPGIEAFDGAKEGIIEHDIPYAKLTSVIGEVGEKYDGNTLVISRRNAPLVSLAYALVADRVPFILKGRDFGKTIKKVVKMIALSHNGKSIKRGFEWENFSLHLNDWYARQVRNLDNNGAEKPAYLALDDKKESIMILYQHADVDNPFDFLDEIDMLFPEETENGHNTITLCSIHKAKGLERQSVIVMEHDRLPFAWKDITPEQAAQENNLLFVALTRSKEYLGLALAPSKDTEEF